MTKTTLRKYKTRVCGPLLVDTSTPYIAEISRQFSRSNRPLVLLLQEEPAQEQGTPRLKKVLQFFRSLHDFNTALTLLQHSNSRSPPPTLLQHCRMLDARTCPLTDGTTLPLHHLLRPHPPRNAQQPDLLLPPRGQLLGLIIQFLLVGKHFLKL